MTILPMLIVAGLALVFFAATACFIRSLLRRSYLEASVIGVLVLPFAIYFTYAVSGLVVPRSPEAVFQYALGFSPPAGISILSASERQGFHPGVDVFLCFQAQASSLEHILVQAHFKTVPQSEFAEALSRTPNQPGWWQPAKDRPTRFWHSRQFAGPYSVHDAFLAQSAGGTIWAFITAFE